MISGCVIHYNPIRVTLVGVFSPPRFPHMKSRALLRQMIPISARLVLSLGLVSAGLVSTAPAQQPATPLGIFEAHSDVGITPKPGSATYDPATEEYRVTGGGANTWAGVDAFNIV
jgi:hypothetical protein